MLVGDQRNCHVVQEKAQFPHKENGYHGAVSTSEVVASLLDTTRKELKKKVLAHQCFKTDDKTRYRAASKGHCRYPGCWAGAVRTVQTVGRSLGRGRGSDKNQRDSLGLGTGGS
jgi:hypothetical protein